MSTTDINKERLTAVLKRDEGCNLEKHEVAGIDHIGVGFNLEVEWDDELLFYLGVEDEDDIEVITQEQADYILSHEIASYTDYCKELYGEAWDIMSPLRREIVVNVCFNVGKAGIRKFRKMNNAIRAGDWGEASGQMLDSKAARQTGERYSRLSMAFESDDQSFLDLPDFQDDSIVVDANDGDNPLAKYTDEELLTEVKRRMGKA